MKRFCLIFGCVLSAACASSTNRGPANSAEDYYVQALEDLEEGMYPEAVLGFTVLKNKFPYSKYAALADLRIGDVQFERGRYIEAVDAFRNFLKFYPRHEKGSYAMYKIASAYREQIPSSFFLLPPAEEKDQASTRLAISAYKDMLTRYPESPETEQANTELDECRRLLADHEIYVADFYFQREHWLAAANRAESLLKDYGGLGLDARALIIAARSRFELEEHAPATEAAARLQNEFPESSEAERARELLEKIGPLKSTTEESKSDSTPESGD
ncbi:MAG: outer membrane protein assembly factor BamD, partial [Myxococcota bacterium]